MASFSHSLQIRPLAEARILVSGRGQIREEPACPPSPYAKASPYALWASGDTSGDKKLACRPKLTERRGKCTQAYMRIPILFLTNPETKRQWFRKRSIVSSLSGMDCMQSKPYKTYGIFFSQLADRIQPKWYRAQA